VTGRCEHTTGIAPFARLVQQVNAEPYASARRVFWIVDNGSSHRGTAPVQRMARAWPSAQLIHLPAHASWLDQAEIYFSVVQRKAPIPSDFTSLDQIRDRLAAFEIRYNTIARPFSWKFTRTDLHDLLNRLDPHQETQAPRPGSLTPDELTDETTKDTARAGATACWRPAPVHQRGPFPVAGITRRRPGWCPAPISRCRSRWRSRARPAATRHPLRVIITSLAHHGSRRRRWGRTRWQA
jgi:hypothetical protein